MTSQPQTPGHERRVETNGVTLALTEYPAARPPLVLLHGVGSRGVSWWPVIDALAVHFHLYVFDLRGHGGSGKPERGYDLTDYTTDLASALDTLELERPCVMGHSLGSLVSLTLLRDYPARVGAVVLEDPPLRSEPTILAAIDGWTALSRLPLEQVIGYYQEQNPGWSVEDCIRRAESITGTAPGVFAELRAEAEAVIAIGGSRLGTLRSVDSPTLLVRGDVAAGSMVAPADAERLAVRFPRIRLAHVPGAGHSIHREHAAAFLDLALPFLRASHGG